MQACGEGHITTKDEDMYLPSILLAGPVIDALDEYFTERRKYPSDLNELVPDFLPSLPESQYGDKFGYVNAKDVQNYEGDHTYDLFFSPRSRTAFFRSREARVFLYTPNGKYNDRELITVHFIVKDWAYVTLHRNRVGEGGRIE
jgi:hypothetical protein